MSRYQAYEEYKESDSKWLRLIPKNWIPSRIKYLSKSIGTGGTPKNESSFTDDVEVSWLSPGDFQASLIIDSSTKNVTYKSCILGDAKLFMSGSVAVIGIGATLGKVGFCNENFSCNQQVNVISPLGNVSGMFVAYALSVQIEQMKQCSNASTIGIMNQEKTGEVLIACPTLVEQEKITNFLNHETAKIDTLIAKQQQLIQLLKEKRQAVISHAVTKGLNPNAPMRDSGVEWLGEVPAHWDVLCIKHMVEVPVTDGPHETPNFLDSGIPFISAEAVSSGCIDFEKIRAHISVEDNSRYSQKYSPKKYDIYMVKSGATTGITAIVETDMIFNIWSPLAVIRCKNDSYPYFILNFLRSVNFKEAVELNWSFGTQQNIGMGVIENLHVTRPPIDEAKIIADTLRKKCSVFDEIINRANKQIELSQERRTALISAAVTGKIDVRNWQPSTSFTLQEAAA